MYDAERSYVGTPNAPYRNRGPPWTYGSELWPSRDSNQSLGLDVDFANTEYRSDVIGCIAPTEISEDEVTNGDKSAHGDKFMLLSDRLTKDETVLYDERLDGSMPYDDGSIAFGTIMLYENFDDFSVDGTTYIRGHVSDDLYPNILIKAGLGKKWIRLDGLSIGTRSGITSIRVYLLPEDVDRTNRGNVKDFRKMVKYLLNFVDCSTAAWQGKSDPHGTIKIYKEPVLEQEESLFYIFNTLRSPQPDISNYKGGAPGLQAMSDVLEDNVVGLNTPLYPYQKRSVAAMVKKEADPARMRDPRKHKMLDIYGQCFFLDFNEGALYRQQPLYHEPKGGILAETMGYGKTLICLALIMATRGHYPPIPHFCAETRLTTLHTKTPSLLTMAARKLKHEGLPWKNEFYALKKAGDHYDRCIQELKLYERCYNEPVAGALNPTRKGKPEYTNMVRLCSSTLIVVPPNLIIQWQQEIDKHIDKDAIDVLVVDAAGIAIPQWQELIKYDVVLISKSRFEQEYRDDDLNQGKGIRYAEKYKSPLTDVRWLRVICDEGHGFAGSATKTNAMAMLDKMFIERRWVVSGTPSSTLHGVEVGLASEDFNNPKTGSTRRLSFGTVLKDRRGPNVQNSEVKDLERLRLIVVNFLKLQPWANKKGVDQADWKTYLAPRVTSDGRRCGLPALREVMQTLIIRHRIQDVDCDLTLPALHVKVTYLEPSYYDRLSINLFIMILVSNYVTSEREDEDYMFHPRNRGKLTTLINNLGHATFYWIGITSQNVKDTVQVSSTYLNKNIDKVTDEDGLLLTEAVLNGEKALSDSGWLSFSKLHEMGTYIGRFPKNAQKAWSLDETPGDPLLMGTTQAREVQKHVQIRFEKDPRKALNHLQHHGNKIMNSAREKAEEEQMQLQKHKIGTEQKDVGTIDAPSKRAPTTSSSPSKASYSSTHHASRATKTPESVSCGLQLPCADSNTLPDSEIVGFASAKLTYLCKQLLSHPEEKSIIFYNHNNTAFFIAEALELLHIPFLIYANTLSVRQRAEYLAKFNTDTETRVLLMDLKQASQGLHVAAASRVYIVSPIWDQAMESQAIKRAHRIGQRREVIVETLVLQGTFEEDLIKRRKQRTDSGQLDSAGVHQPEKQASKKTKGAPGNPMLEDKVMVNVLKNIKFLKFRPEDENEKMVRLPSPVPLFRIDATPSAHENRNGVQPSSLQSPATYMPSTPSLLSENVNSSGTKELSIHSSQTSSAPEVQNTVVGDKEVNSTQAIPSTAPSIFGSQTTTRIETTLEKNLLDANFDIYPPDWPLSIERTTEHDQATLGPPSAASKSNFGDMAAISVSKRKFPLSELPYQINSYEDSTDSGGGGDDLSASLAKRLKVGPSEFGSVSEKRRT